jgi:putative ABC transport system permease protein
LPYRITNQQEMLDTITQMLATMTLFLAWIAAISLLVWGIGVMNIMLVSVTERTKEIWIRKAIWASGGDILLQFLTEASVLSLTGWWIWILFSYFVCEILQRFDIPAIISINSIIMSFSFSLWIWLIFGIFPAYKAAQLRPIEALRFE